MTFVQETQTKMMLDLFEGFAENTLVYQKFKNTLPYDTYFAPSVALLKIAEHYTVDFWLKNHPVPGDLQIFSWKKGESLTDAEVREKAIRAQLRQLIQEYAEYRERFVQKWGAKVIEAWLAG
ncbi:MAG: hypothetical protein HPY81_02120 [Firmicutes bacterium]|nr:hypothetical protein [Bacillota bacterium]